MRSVFKDVLYPGEFTLADGRRWECTPAAVRQAVATGNKMLAVGHVAPPVIWQHDIDSNPEHVSVLLSMIENPRQWAADYAKNTFGWGERFSCETVKGEPVACSFLTIPAEADAVQFAKARFVSARVNVGYTDPDGRHWPGTSIGHIAATPTPIQMRQLPVMLSASTSRPARGQSRVTYFLSQSGGRMPDPKKDDEKPTGGTDTKEVSRLLNNLTSLNHVMPEGVTDLPGVNLALETIIANQGGAAPEPDEDDYTPEPGDTSGTGTADVPAMLSTITDPTARRLVENQIKDGRAELVRRLDRVEKVAIAAHTLSVPEAKQLRSTFEAMTDSVMLSVIEHGGNKSRAVLRLELLERMHKIKPNTARRVGVGAKEKTVNLSTVVPVPRLGGSTAEPTKEQIDAEAAATRARLSSNRALPPKK